MQTLSQARKNNVPRVTRKQTSNQELEQNLNKNRNKNKYKNKTKYKYTLKTNKRTRTKTNKARAPTKKHIKNPQPLEGTADKLHCSS